MIQLSEMFNYIGNNGCCDVASSLAMNNVNFDVSIPIYEIAYLKILPGEKAGFICGSLPEYSALRKLASSCGAVAVTLNLLDLDILTLMGALCVYTPKTGAHFFFKNNIPDLQNLTSSIVEQLADLLGVPIVAELLDTAQGVQNIGSELINKLVDLLVGRIESDLGTKGVAIHKWEEIDGFYSHISSTGEMQQMQQYRIINHCAIC